MKYKTLPINMIDFVRARNWTGLTVAELYHAGRLGTEDAAKKNIEHMATQFYEPLDLDEYKALMALANEAYEYLVWEETQMERGQA